MTIHQVGHKLRDQIHHFSGKLCLGLGKVASRFVEEMIYGIQARGSVRLSETARALDEETSVKKVVDRLSRNLGRQGLARKIGDSVLREGSFQVRKNTLLIVDPSDITKKYARRMEGLAKVRDGSEKKIGRGYWLNVIVGAEQGSAEIVPLVHELYSQSADDFVSENHQILEGMSRVHQAAGGRGIFVIDRGGDRRRLYRELLGSAGYRFIIRQRGDRDLLYRGKKQRTLDLALACKRPYRETVIKEKDGRETPYQIEFGFMPVRLPEHPDQTLWLVVVTGFGQKPLMLLTTEPMRRTRKVIWRIVQAYITRWRVEETIRFIKRSYDLEDIRVLTYERLKNMSALVLAAAFFAAVHLGMKTKLEILALHVLEAAGRIFGIPNFRYYALADGIKEILSKGGKGVSQRKAADLKQIDQGRLFQP
jgi:hypothetical protein